MMLKPNRRQCLTKKGTGGSNERPTQHVILAVLKRDHLSLNSKTPRGTGYTRWSDLKAFTNAEEHS